MAALRRLLVAIAVVGLAVACSAARPSNLALPVDGAAAPPTPPTEDGQGAQQTQAPAPPADTPSPGSPTPPGLLEVEFGGTLLANPSQQEPAVASPPSPPPPPLAPPTPRKGGKQCVLLPQTDPDGELLVMLKKGTAADCCDACKDTTNCNVWCALLSLGWAAWHCPSSLLAPYKPTPSLVPLGRVFCDRGGGCDDGSGKYYEEGSCALKLQPPIPAGGEPSVYAKGSLVHWSAGYMPA